MVVFVRHSRFKSNPFGDGGAKRSAQIEELLQQSGVEYVNDNFILPKEKSLRKKVAFFWRGMKLVLKEFTLSEIRSVSNFIAMSKYFGLRIPVFGRYTDKKVVFINEDTTPGAYGFPYLAQGICKPMISAPHNLESLSGAFSDVQTGKPKRAWLSEDIYRLRLCDSVFCISKEETWLLQVHGVNAYYLPYYPPKEAEKYLLSVRAKREQHVPTNNRAFLVLGSISNQPTREGMESLLSNLSHHDCLPFEVRVAGYGTENIRMAKHPQIFYYGSVSEEKLEELLVEASGLIVNQPPTSGALTRIVENLVAGIPVFASFGAARDYFQEKDVNVYASFGELMELLEVSSYRVATMPAHNTKAEQMFVNICKNYASNSL